MNEILSYKMRAGQMKELYQFSNISPWSRAPCSACTLPNSRKKTIIFELEGLCERFKTFKKVKWCVNHISLLKCKTFRTGLDTKYVLLNDDDTGLLTYVGRWNSRENHLPRTVWGFLCRKKTFENPVWSRSEPVDDKSPEQSQHHGQFICFNQHQSNWWKAKDKAVILKTNSHSQGCMSGVWVEI